MKTFIKMINCLENYIKKNFFNLSKNNIYHDCEGLREMDFSAEDEHMPEEEYATIYKGVTRWQTL